MMREELTESELYKRYDELLDDVYPSVEIGGSSFYPSTVLKECDPTAYRTGFNEWLDGEVNEGTIRVDQRGTYYG